MCCGFSLAVYYMRCVGPDAAFDRLDAATLKAFDTFVAAVDDVSRPQIQMPVRHGGFGLRPAAPFATIAHMAATRSAYATAKVLQAQHCPTGLAEPDFRHVAAAASSAEEFHSYACSLQAYLDGPAKAGDHAQKLLSRALEDARAAVWRKSLMTRHDQARVNSCSRAFASAYLMPVPFEDQIVGWLSAAEFQTAARLRLGQPLTAAPITCRLCCAKEADVYGNHSLVCLNHGLRTRLHDNVRDFVSSAASTALLRPQREVQCFGPTGKRCDIFIDGSHPRAIDVAITHFATLNNLKHAAETPGGAATKYETSVKTVKYGALATAARVVFAPVVFDTLGALGDSGLETMKFIATKWGQRFNLAPSRAITVVMQRLSSLFMQGICRMLLVNSTPETEFELAATTTLVAAAAGDASTTFTQSLGPVAIHSPLGPVAAGAPTLSGSTAATSAGAGAAGEGVSSCSSGVDEDQLPVADYVALRLALKRVASTSGPAGAA
jgi:hypothetical protein